MKALSRSRISLLSVLIGGHGFQRGVLRPSQSMLGLTGGRRKRAIHDRTLICSGNRNRKEMFYLTTHSTHFIYGYMASDIIMVKDHSDSERGNPLPPHGQQGFFYMQHPTDRVAHTTAFITSVVEHWPEREKAQWVHPTKDRSDDPSHHERTLLPGNRNRGGFRDCLQFAGHSIGELTQNV